MELRLPLEMSPGREAACRAVFGTWGFFSERRTEKLPLRVDLVRRSQEAGKSLCLSAPAASREERSIFFPRGLGHEPLMLQAMTQVTVG